MTRGEWTPQVEFFADASGSIGMGMLWGERWCAEFWPSFPGRATNIAILEMVPLILAAEIWGSEWRGKKILFRSDNMAVVHAVNGWLPRDPHLVSLLKRLARMAILQCFHIRCLHVRGVDNVDADLPSRDILEEFTARHSNLDLVRIQFASLSTALLIKRWYVRHNIQDDQSHPLVHYT